MKKITLKNLHEATAQEVFDQVAVHLLKQNKKSATDGGACMYKYENLKCAAGCLIDDDEYSSRFEGLTWLRVVGRVFDSPHFSLISELQELHDSSEVGWWKKDLILVAARHGLNTNAIENFK